MKLPSVQTTTLIRNIASPDLTLPYIVPPISMIRREEDPLSLGLLSVEEIQHRIPNPAATGFIPYVPLPVDWRQRGQEIEFAGYTIPAEDPTGTRCGRSSAIRTASCKSST